MLIKLLKWAKRSKADEKGFTLIELLIVIVIIGILAAVAVPTYTKYMTTAKAASAFNGISAIVQYVEGVRVASADGATYPAAGTIAADISPDTVNFAFGYDATVVTATGQGDLAGTDIITYTLATGAWTLAGDLTGIAIPTQ